MATYTIIGDNEKEYGPITGSDVRQWISEGRLNEHTLTKAEGETEWRPLSTFPEFADLLAVKTPPPIAPAPSTGFTGSVGRDYELDMGGCLTRGWELFKNNFGLLFVTAFVVMLIEGAIGGLGAIPVVGPVFSLVNMVVAGPLMGGLYYVYIQTIRHQPAEVGDVFAGFTRAFGQLFFGHFVTVLLAGLCLIPFLIILIVMLVPVAEQGQLSAQHVLSTLSGTSLTVLGVALFVCLIPMIYLQTCWLFTLPLIIDKQMDFGTAMKTSWKMVNKHWWQVFGLSLLIGLVNLAGALACLVGLLFTVPIGFAALMSAYETIFGGQKN